MVFPFLPCTHQRAIGRDPLKLLHLKSEFRFRESIRNPMAIHWNLPPRGTRAQAPDDCAEE